MISGDEAFIRLMLAGYHGLIRPVMFASAQGDPEVIHHRVIGLLGELPELVRNQLTKVLGQRNNPIEIAGVKFPGRVGVAAGLDKDGVAAQAWAALGFGFAELGTVTAHAQPGNPLPRVFRLPASRAIINRMGFNNLGAEALGGRLQAWQVSRGNAELGMPIGISIGKTKITPLNEAVEDYLASFAAVADYADYIAINVSSPNTPNLRDLQARESLRELTQALVNAAKEHDPAKPMPIFLKLAPDLSDNEIAALIEVCEETGISGLIATNTTITRQYLHPSEQHLASQAGGLSGAPLTRKALGVVEMITARTDLPVIGSGGIMTPADAQDFFDAGVSLVQLYTGFIYNGPALVQGINRLTRPDRNR